MDRVLEGRETAADVTVHKVLAIKGFGEVLTQGMMNWRKSCERRFVYNPALAVSEADRNKVRASVAARKRAIEAALLTGPQKLQHIKQQAVTNATMLLPAAAEAAGKLAQAEADCSLI